MPDTANLELLTDLAVRAGGRSHMRPVLEKELLHYDILFALDSSGLLDGLTFQGGTCLRLCYGAQRLSEDLDFVGGWEFRADRLQEMKACLERYIGQRYGLEVFVKEPRELAREPEHRDLTVDKWRITVVTAPEQRHMPRQKIKLEVATVPAYSREPRDVKANYDFLPDGYGDIIVLCETLDEIMADKVVSFVNCQAYVRHRDIWDLRWLRAQGARVQDDLIAAKIQDYKARDFAARAEAMAARLPEIVGSKAFQDQMTRFLPMDVVDRTMNTEKFRTFLANEVGGLLAKAGGMV